MQNTYIFVILKFATNFLFFTEELNCKPVLIFSQMLWILSIR